MRELQLSDAPQLPSVPRYFAHLIPNEALVLEIDAGRFTPLQSRAISTEILRSSSPENATVRLIELQWDMQTGNFMEESLGIIASAVAHVPGRPQCLSALLASGSRCLQVFVLFPKLTNAETLAFNLLSDPLQVRPFAISPAHVQLVCNFIRVIICAITARHYPSFEIIH
jgi:hypothetical protein